jgi:hypothetical protein
MRLPQASDPVAFSRTFALLECQHRGDLVVIEAPRRALRPLAGAASIMLVIGLVPILFGQFNLSWIVAMLILTALVLSVIGWVQAREHAAGPLAIFDLTSRSVTLRQHSEPILFEDIESLEAVRTELKDEENEPRIDVALVLRLRDQTDSANTAQTGPASRTHHAVIGVNGMAFAGVGAQASCLSGLPIEFYKIRSAA